jgi:hypothetical protein
LNKFGLLLYFREQGIEVKLVKMSYHLYYKLDEKRHVVAIDCPLEWAEYFETADRSVDKTDITSDCHVSTVFLGLDHNFADEGPPLLFGTMVFGGPFDGHMKRYSTYGEAHKGHWEVVDEIKEDLGILEEEK